MISIAESSDIEWELLFGNATNLQLLVSVYAGYFFCKSEDRDSYLQLFYHHSLYSASPDCRTSSLLCYSKRQK